MNLQTNPILESTSYDRADCKIGIVHLGFGAFHRAHQAVYIDDCIEQTGDANWGIAAVNLRSAESDVFHASANMENGYLLKTTSPSSQIRYESPPRPGQEHHLVMLDGILMLTLGNASYELRAGDCLRYQLTTSSLFETGPQNGADYHLFLI